MQRDDPMHCPFSSSEEMQKRNNPKVRIICTAERWWLVHKLIDNMDQNTKQNKAKKNPSELLF